MNSAYHNIIDRFDTARVLLIGDIILDTYLKGDSTRLSPEAPVPVVNVICKEQLVGGAANIAINLRALGAKVTFLSVLGDDEDAEVARSILRNSGVDTGMVIVEAGRKTMVKTRVMSQHQILARFDHGSRTPVSEESQQVLIDFLNKNYEAFDLVVVGDYYSGILTGKVIESLKLLQRKNPKFLAVDSKNLLRFREIGPSLVKPNYNEAARLLDLNEPSPDRAVQMQEMGYDLYEKTGAGLIALTLDADGALIFEKGSFVYRAFAHQVPSPNVIGAGDTFISAYALALSGKADIPVATELATAAAAIAVKKEDTAPCYQAELRSFFAMHNKIVIYPQELKKLCEIYQAQGKRIIFTNGCFDILHSGHVNYLNRAKELGDILIVGLNNDESIRRLKGSDRPINPLEDRMQVLAGLSAIDHIIPFGDEKDDTPVELIKVVRPDFYAKGGDYTREMLPEAKVVEELGGEIVFVPLTPDHSTTLIIKKINGGIPYRLAQA